MGCFPNFDDLLKPLGNHQWWLYYITPIVLNGGWLES